MLYCVHVSTDYTYNLVWSSPDNIGKCITWIKKMVSYPNKKGVTKLSACHKIYGNGLRSKAPDITALASTGVT